MSNFFKNLFSSLFGADDPEVIKRKALKNVAKNLARTKYKFYRFNSHEADPSFAKFLYEIYKVISPAQLMFQNMTPLALKMMVINSSLSDEKRELIDELSEANLKELGKKMSLADLTEKVRSNYESIMSDMDNLALAKIDALYSKFVAMKNFCTFDFYFALKKFDSNLVEHNFSSIPRFSAVNGTYIAEDLKNFIAVAWSLPFNADWDDVFKALKRTREVEPITLTNWKRIIAHLKPVKDKKVIEMMIRLVTENPEYAEEFNFSDLHIIDEYLSDVRKVAENFISQTKAKQSEAKANSLLKQIFGSSEIEPLKHYNNTYSSQFERKNLGSYKYGDPLSVLKAFLMDYTKKELRELSDILLVRAEWTNQQLASPMSEAFHQLMEIANEVVSFDNKLGDTAEIGAKFKTYLPRAERDKEARNIILMLLNDTNDEAAEMILLAVKNFVIYARNLKMLLEDFVKPHGEIVLNWKEIDHYAEEKLKDMCIDAYKKIFSLVSLIQSYNVKRSEQNQENKK